MLLTADRTRLTMPLHSIGTGVLAQVPAGRIVPCKLASLIDEDRELDLSEKRRPGVDHRNRLPD